MDVFNTVQQVLAEHPVLAPLGYVLCHIVFAVCIIPCSPMAVIAGLLWGKWLGLLLSIIGAFSSSCTTFLLSRRYMKQPIYRFLSKRYAKTDWFLEQTHKHGWKFVATVQLNPAAPASTLGYLFGLTEIQFSRYAALTLALMLPLQLLLVVAGDSFSKALMGQASMLIMIGFVVLLAVVVIYKMFFKKTAAVMNID